MSPDFRSRYTGKAAQLKEVLRSCKYLFREIENLVPAVDKGASPANVEYPWFDGRKVKATRDDAFQVLAQLNSPEGRNVLKVISTSIIDIAATSES